MIYEIMHWPTGVVLFSVEAGSLKLAVEIAVRQKVNLIGAHLAGADLAGAHLAGAHLAGAKNILSVGPTSDGYEFFAVPSDKGLMIKAGCHWFSYTEALAYYTADKRGIGPERRAYLAAIASIATARGWTLQTEQVAA